MPRTCTWCGMETADLHQCEWCQRVLDPVSASTNAPAGAPPPNDPADNTDDCPVTPLAPLSIRLEWFLGLALPLLAVSMAAAHFVPVACNIVTVSTSFCAGFLVSVYQVVQSVDEHWAPVGFAVVLSLMFGPVFVLAGFLALVIMTRVEGCATVVILLSLHLLSAIAIAYSAAPELQVALRMAGAAPQASLPGLMTLAVVAGWTAANFWRPLDE